MFNFLVQFIPRAVVQGVPLMYGCVGETITEKSGNLNLGTPGIMYVGGICGVIGAFFYENAVGNNMNPFLGVFIPLMCTLIGSLLMGLIYSFLTVTLRANQNVTGLALTTFGIGIGNFFGGSLIKISGADVPSIVLSRTSKLFSATIPGASKLGAIGEVLFSYSTMVYVAILFAILAALIISKTRVGLNLRSVGESPATADAAGINVEKYKYFATCIGAMVSGLGGLFYVMGYASGIWSNDAFGDRGWLALALVIFTIWRPGHSIWASIIFGGLFILHNYIPTGVNLANKELYKIIPYLATIIILIITSVRNKRENQPPESLGLSYFREDR
ncbi:MAG: ABC transporter permease [Lachnospiraceae bacterium]|nr:ABC transporter permease [Lachnospiraceae bacterium]